MSARNAASFTMSPSRKSMARTVALSSRVLNTCFGSFNSAPFGNVSRTALLSASPMQMFPSRDHTGTPIGRDGFFHFTSSTMDASALRTTARSRASVVLRQSPDALMMASMARDAAGSWRGPLVRGVILGSLLTGRSARSSHTPGGSLRIDQLPVLRKVRVGARGQVETARPTLPALHLRDADFDAALTRAGILGRIDPPNPLPARHRRDVLPQFLDPVRRRSEGRPKILRDLRLRPVVERHELDRRGVSSADGGGPLLLRVDSHPVAELAIRFDDGLGRVAIDGCLHRHLATGRQLLARLVRQPRDGRPIDGVQGRLEAHCGRGFGGAHGQHSLISRTHHYLGGGAASPR